MLRRSTPRPIAKPATLCPIYGIKHAKNSAFVEKGVGMADCPWAYLDGQIIPAKTARIPIFDRGLLFAQSAYEVTTVYGGKLIDGPAHMQRLARSLAGLELTMPISADELLALHELIVQRNELVEGGVYLQITAGDYGGRDFAGPTHFRPRVFMFAQARPLIDQRAEHGMAAITGQDWKGCQSCVNYDILTRTKRKHCLCTGMLYDPVEKYKHQKKSFKDYKGKYGKWLKAKKKLLLKKFKK